MSRFALPTFADPHREPFLQLPATGQASQNRRCSMTKAYRILAYLIAAGVVIQAAVITLASFGFSKWIDNGGVADLATFQSGNLNFFGSIGYELHGTNGALYI